MHQFTIAVATAEDVQVADTLAGYPSAGRHVGPGLHVLIPSDWATRIGQGESVPGVTTGYALDPELGATLAVKAEDVTQERIDARSALVDPVRLSAFLAKLSTATSPDEGTVTSTRRKE